MGLFDFFKRRKPSVPLPQLCYDIAYFILPHYAYQDFERVDAICRENPEASGPFYYVMACQMRKVEPEIETAKTFHWHVGAFEGGVDYLTLAYPTVPAIDLADTSPSELLSSTSSLVLAPYFSSVLRDRDGKVSYYVLGQAPIGGRSTLRCVTAEGANCNLGPGPKPNLEKYHAALSERIEPKS